MMNEQQILGELREITYKCRDIGYGVERGWARGRWAERDWTGKRSFVRAGESTLYLFDDEVVSDEPAGVVYRVRVHLGNPAHRARCVPTNRSAGGVYTWTCSCGDTLFTLRGPDDYPDEYRSEQ